MTVDLREEKELAQQRFKEICKHAKIVDTHNDFPYLLRVQLRNKLQLAEFDFENGLTSHTDLVKMRQGQVGVQFFSCFIECKNPNYLYQDFDTPTTVVRDTLEQIDVTRRLVCKYNNDLKFVDCADDAIAAFRNNGKIAIALGVEGLHQVDTSLAVLRQYYSLGVRYITLTHNCDNPFATAASSITGGLPDRGLSAYGIECIFEMNRLGMMVDLSHVSHRTMHDALDVTKAPVIFSHSSAYTLTEHERNVRDDVLERLKTNGGVVQVNFYQDFIRKPGSDRATIDDAADHILHIIKVAGWEHVGLGSDFDGIPQGPKGLEDVSKYPDLICKIIERTNATNEQIEGLMGLNVLRVWKKTELVALQLSKKLEPIESSWSGRKWEFYSYAKEFPELFPDAYKLNEKSTVWNYDQPLNIEK
ncbi:Dipeptidase [Schizosaccharomyces pombe]|uniref:Uncharacterized dipeptidase C965.12 n=1 Tax=Schizosaccharomyces pombe (strain 972 / ATCC 24843) TaxID=284812 RepID=DPEH2_SCHPO|nr:putative dipeptidyl peptidase [Schizosaccharomyces pombe]O59832.1 RecName: Full=Uncharacterized dipeptidase C965.12 [Schizosaccharomyces pombe 972h-]CAA19072.1 dipeptidyl peptidase (predicted) [Schizosaccharomyces pombe]|eukprot:NP_001342728.1 putative dipeptidyl peptidase [Schizosaccharomyces pombe]